MNATSISNRQSKPKIATAPTQRRSDAEFERLRRDAKVASKQADASHWDLARALYSATVWTAKNGDSAWKLWGFKSFREWIESELGIATRTARTLRSTFFRFEVQLKGRWDRRNMLPISKMAICANLVTEANCDEILTWAKTKSVSELQQFTHRGFRTRNEGFAIPEASSDDFTYGRHYQLTGEEADLVDEAMKLARQISRSNRRGAHLALVCQMAIRAIRTQAREQTGAVKVVKTDRKSKPAGLNGHRAVA